VPFIKEYIDLRHMSLASAVDIGSCRYFFLPHHCVLKKYSSTTKCCAVFDGSAASLSGYSLNNVLMADPVILHALLQILLWFRSHTVAITGNICKMCRCVGDCKEGSYLQCILWRDSHLRVFQLDTVTYGTKPASFKALRTMHKVSADSVSPWG